jgi:spore coat polysaccharide biosynthesis protein SpsF
MVNKSKYRVVASIEARMGSTRFPGKVLSNLRGRPTLLRLVDRLRQCALVDDIVLATTLNSEDDILEAFAKEHGLACHRGSQDDVLLRVLDAHRMMKSDLIVEVTGDCPLLDPDLIDEGIKCFIESDCDLVTNLVPPTWPMGVDLQVFRCLELERIERAVHDPEVREHVSLYFYEQPERYRIINVSAPENCKAPNYRFQLDYLEDKVFIESILDRVLPIFGDRFRTADIMKALQKEPELLLINIDCKENSPR